MDSFLPTYPSLFTPLALVELEDVLGVCAVVALAGDCLDKLLSLALLLAQLDQTAAPGLAGGLWYSDRLRFRSGRDNAQPAHRCGSRGPGALGRSC